MHWFEHRLPLEPEWQVARSNLEKTARGLLQLWAEQKTRVDRYGIEASLEQAFIQPVFQLLGWKLKYQTFLQGREPDYALFRDNEALLATRPIYHSSDMAIRGHVFCSFLALLLVKELEDRLHRHNLAAEWDDILRDLDRLQEIELEQDGKRFLLRTPTTGVAGKLFQAVGVALPPNLQELPLTTPQPAA